MSKRWSGDQYAEFESPIPLAKDPEIGRWRQRLLALSTHEVSIRQAVATGQDGRRMWDLQLDCPPITPRRIRDNVAMISTEVVLLAEIDGVHAGFSVSHTGQGKTEPLFIQVVAVAPSMQNRRLGLALLLAAAEREPQRDIALATQDSNQAAHALNKRFAESIGSTIRRVPLSTYRDRDLGIRRGLGYHSWLIQRP